jgi:YesN/AraC family two-component response regulator
MPDHAISYSILLVDDDMLILEVLRIQIEQFIPRHVLIELASSGEEALQLIRDYENDHGATIEIIISDYFMPGMTGAEFLKTAHAIHPLSKKILLTGQSEEETVKSLLTEHELFAYMPKPWSSEHLRELIEKFIDEIETRLNVS